MCEKTFRAQQKPGDTVKTDLYSVHEYVLPHLFKSLVFDLDPNGLHKYSKTFLRGLRRRFQTSQKKVAGTFDIVQFLSKNAQACSHRPRIYICV